MAQRCKDVSMHGIWRAVRSVRRIARGEIKYLDFPSLERNGWRTTFNTLDIDYAISLLKPVDHGREFVARTIKKYRFIANVATWNFIAEIFARRCSNRPIQTAKAITCNCIRQKKIVQLEGNHLGQPRSIVAMCGRFDAIDRLDRIKKLKKIRESYTCEWCGRCDESIVRPRCTYDRGRPIGSAVLLLCTTCNKDLEKWKKHRSAILETRRIIKFAETQLSNGAKENGKEHKQYRRAA